MNDNFFVRPVADGEQRAVLNVLSQALHRSTPTDEEWAATARSWPAEGKFGAYEGDTPIGVASSFVTEMLVPGGRAVPAAAVDGVAVRADRTRRGVLTALMRAQLDDLAARGVVLASLHASEATIYGRFGYGVAALGKTLHVERPAARFRDSVRVGGQVRLLSAEEAVKEIPGLYRRIGLFRPGMITRPDSWWGPRFDQQVTAAAPFRVAVHSGPDGDDGFVVYQPSDQRTLEGPYRGALLSVGYLHAADPAAVAGLWRFLVSVDLVSAIVAPGRPGDEHVDTLLTDPRACRTTAVVDELSLRLVDVGAALAARSYRTASPVVLDVVDDRLPGNNGRYLVGSGRTDLAADLRLDVETLAMLYLGEWRASTLAQAGRIEVLDETALGRADELFATSVRPWCGTKF